MPQVGRQGMETEMIKVRSKENSALTIFSSSFCVLQLPVAFRTL